MGSSGFGEPVRRAQWVMSSTLQWATPSAEGLSSQAFQCDVSLYSTQAPEPFGTTRVYDLNAESPIAWSEGGLAVRRLAPAAPFKLEEPGPSQLACDLLDKGLQKAVEETMAFQKGFGRLPAPWEG